MFLTRNLFNAALVLLFLYSGSLKAADIIDGGEMPTIRVAADWCGNKTDGSHFRPKTGNTYVCISGKTTKILNPDGSYKTCVGYCGSSEGVGEEGKESGSYGNSITADDGNALTGNGSQSGATIGVGGSADGSAEPELPTPTAPTPRELTAQEKGLIEAFKALRERYVSAFKSLQNEAISIKKTLAASLESCINRFGAGTKLHQECAASAKKSAQEAIAKVQEKMNAAEAQMEKDFAELEKQIPKTGNVGSINVNFGDGVQDSGGVNVTVNNGSSSTNPVTGGGTTVNNGGSTTINNGGSTTVNNTTINNGGGRGSSDHGQFEDKNDVSDFCAKNPNALMCLNNTADAPEVAEPDTDGWVSQIMDVLKSNGEGKKAPDFRLDKFLNAGHMQCPAPLTMQVYKFTAQMSFDWVCKFLSMVRPFVIIAFLISTSVMVIMGVRK